MATHDLSNIKRVEVSRNFFQRVFRRHSTLNLTVVVLSIISSSISLIRELSAEELPVFGPVTFLREIGKPATVTYAFPKLPQFEPPFRVIIINGDQNGASRVSSGSVFLNHKNTVGVTIKPED